MVMVLFLHLYLLHDFLFLSKHIEPPEKTSRATKSMISAWPYPFGCLGFGFNIDNSVIVW